MGCPLFILQLTKIFFYIIITTNVIVMVVITQITLRKIMQILEGSMIFVEWIIILLFVPNFLNLYVEIFGKIKII
jgi:hypothetical protein